MQALLGPFNKTATSACFVSVPFRTTLSYAAVRLRIVPAYMDCVDFEVNIRVTPRIEPTSRVALPR